MRFVTADSIHVGDGTVMNQGVVAFDENGKIHHVLSDRSDPLIPAESLEIIEGVICPGFVNAHCHLELSHLKGKLTPGTGLPRFLIEVTQHRKAGTEEIQQAMRIAEAEMLSNGIVAVGDISNGTDSINIKRNSAIRYHTFVELIGINAEIASERLEKANQIKEQFVDAGLSATVSPHAPYSLSDKLRKILADQNIREVGPISIHNQETRSENELFKNRSGRLKEVFEDFGLPVDGIAQTGESSLRSILQDLQSSGPLVLVHNAHTNALDMSWAIEHRQDLFWCTCPGANVFIELRNPKIEKWLDKSANVCVGTDSLASNHQLSMVDELELIQTRCPEIGLPELIRLATWNGARALKLDGEFGLLAAGLSPGILHLGGHEIAKGRISSNVKVERLDPIRNSFV